MRTARGIGAATWVASRATPPSARCRCGGPTPTSAARSTARRARARSTAPTSRPSPPTARGTAELTGGLALLLRLAARPPPPPPPAAATAGGSGRPPTVGLSCVDADFVLHNRQLLPDTALRCDGGGDRHRRGEAALARRLRTLHAAAQRSRCAATEGDGAADGAPDGGGGGGGGGAPFSGTVRNELHLSGFFSMASSTYKPWTAALRVGRAFLTPTAPGLVHPPSCAGAGAATPTSRAGSSRSVRRASAAAARRSCASI